MEKKRNIIFSSCLMILGWQDVGFMGNKWFETSNLNKLAKESVNLFEKEPEIAKKC